MISSPVNGKTLNWLSLVTNDNKQIQCKIDFFVFIKKGLFDSFLLPFWSWKNHYWRISIWEFFKSFQCVITDNITLEFEFYKWILWKNLNNPFTYQAWNWLCQDLLCLKIFAQRITLSKWYLNLNKMVIYKPLKPKQGGKNDLSDFGPYCHKSTFSGKKMAENRSPFQGLIFKIGKVKGRKNISTR